MNDSELSSLLRAGILILKARSRAHLVKKVITNKRGKKQTVYVNPNEKKSSKKPKSKKQKEKDDGVEQIWAPSSVQSAKAQAFYDIINDPSIKEPVPRPGRWRTKIPEGLPKETWHDHFDGNPDKGGKPTPQREMLHATIKSRVFSGKKPVEKGKKPVAVLMMGGPASGKSTMVHNAGFNLDDFVVADADAVKSLLPEYRVGVNNRIKKAAAMAHEESSWLVKQMRNEAIDKNMNLVIDGTGAKTASYEKNIAKLRENGYEIKLLMADVPADVGLTRAKKRAKKTGRYVPDDVLKGAYPGIPAGFQKIAALVDSASIYDTNVKLGEPSKLIYSKEGDSETIHDKDHYSHFQSRIGKSWLWNLNNSRSKHVSVQKSDAAKSRTARSKAELLQALARDEWDFTEEEWEMIDSFDDVADPDVGEGIEMILED